MRIFFPFKVWRRIAGATVLGLRTLLNPKDIRALIGFGNLITDTEGFALAAERVKADPAGRALVESRYSQRDFPMETLTQYAPETLGGAFHSHMTRHGLDFYPTSAHLAESDAAYVRERVRETHDILHAVLGYDISIAEEAGLNAFLMAQFAPPISTLIVAGAVIHTLAKSPRELPAVLEKIAEGYRFGKKCGNAMSVKWELEFTRPIAEVRADLGLTQESHSHEIASRKIDSSESSRRLGLARVNPKDRTGRARIPS